MTYGYIRVSTSRQNTENQRFEIANFAQKQDLPIEKWVSEQISSQKDLKKRKFWSLLCKMKKGDVIIATEISRFGRNLLEIMLILSICIKKKCQIWTIKESYKLGFDIISKVLAFAFGFSAEIERNLISARTKEALARAKAEGKTLGRPKGSGKAQRMRKEIIKECSAKGVSKQKIAKKYGVSISSVYRALR